MRSSWPLLIVPVLVDSCPSCTRTWSCPWAPAGSKLAFGKAAWSHWSWLCEQLFCPDTWGFVVLLWSDPRCLGVGALNNLSSPCYLLWLSQRASAFLCRSALLACEPVLWSFISVRLMQTMLWIKFRGDVTPLKQHMERWWTRMRIPSFKKCR